MFRDDDIWDPKMEMRAQIGNRVFRGERETEVVCSVDPTSKLKLEALKEGRQPVRTLISAASATTTT